MIALAHAPIRQDAHQEGRALLEQLYKTHVGGKMPPIERTPRGKPYFPGNPIYFSISHTKKQVFCALSHVPVGIDAEQEDRQIDLRLAEKILSQGEKQRFLTAPDPRQALLRLWVLKEAAAKCTGEGLRGYPNRTDFSPDDPRITTFAGCLVAVVEEA